MASPMADPSVPDFGRKVVPGMTNAPQPMILPRARDQTFIGFNLRSKFKFVSFFIGY